VSRAFPLCTGRYPIRLISTVRAQVYIVKYQSVY